MFSYRVENKSFTRVCYFKRKKKEEKKKMNRQYVNRQKMETRMQETYETRVTRSFIPRIRNTNDHWRCFEQVHLPFIISIVVCKCLFVLFNRNCSRKRKRKHRREGSEYVVTVRDWNEKYRTKISFVRFDNCYLRC